MLTSSTRTPVSNPSVIALKLPPVVDSGVRERVPLAVMAEQKLFYEDVKEGDAAPEFAHELTRTDLVMYAGASGDFNPMHTDEVAAQGAGLPSVFGHGMFTAGILGKALTDYVGVGNLKTYKVRFTKQTWP